MKYDKDFNIDDYDFEDEFAKDDVVQSFSEIPEDEDSPNRDSVIEVEDLINYDEDTHNDKFFKYEFTDSYDIIEEDRIKDAFRDFLNVPKISGYEKGFSENNKIPNNKVKRTKNNIEIKDIPLDEDELKEHLGHYSTVILHKNDADEITSIDVVCSCGNLTKVKFNYDEDSNATVTSTSNVIVKDSSKDPSLLSTDTVSKMIESPDNFDDDLNYNISLMEKFDEVANIFPEITDTVDNSEKNK